MPAPNAVDNKISEIESVWLNLVEKAFGWKIFQDGDRIYFSSELIRNPKTCYDVSVNGTSVQLLDSPSLREVLRMSPH